MPPLYSHLYKTHHYVLQLAAHLTLAYNICMTKHTYYHHTYLKFINQTKITTFYTLTPYSYKAYIQTMYLRTRKINRLIGATALSVNTSEVSLTKAQLLILGQLRTNNPPFLL